VLGIDLIHGRGFRATERVEAGVIIVSESIARRFWPEGAAVGQLVRLEAPSTSPDAGAMPSGPYTVVGVVRESAPASGADLDTVRSIYVPAGVDSPNHALVLRVRGNPEQVRQALLQRLARIDPAPVMMLTYQTMNRMQTYLLQMGFWAAVVLGGLALALTVSGVFSVLSYVVEQQAREIGVRMALGAARRDVVGLILSQSVRPVGLGLTAGVGLAAAVAIVLMTTSIAAEISGDIDVFDPLAYAGSVLVIVTSCALAVSLPALRAARIDPIATLRKE
jgi:ABC-type lipoprotein release transport system permease subunit